MKVNKLAAIIAAAIAVNFTTPTLNALAEEIQKGILAEEKAKSVNSKMEKFTLESHKDFKKYEEHFRIPNTLIEKVTPNGGYHAKGYPENAVDGNINTFWEAKKANSDSFTNEFLIEFKENVDIDRMSYKIRKSLTGFLNKYEIYGSKTVDGDDFELITKGTGETTIDTMEIKFNETNVRRLKIVFVENLRNFAAIAEVGFYKKDLAKESMDRLFTDEGKSVVSEEFNTMEKLVALEKLVAKHPFYDEYKINIEDAYELINSKDINSTTAKVYPFVDINNKEYDKLLKVDKESIKSITNNAGHYKQMVIENAIDGDVNTYFETNKKNTEDWKNEVIVEFKDKVTIDRLVFGGKSDKKGVPEEFEIYTSNTVNGETFKLVATGAHVATNGLIESKFEPTEFKRLKLRYKKSIRDWATLNEIFFYKQDIISEKVSQIFEDGTYSKVSEEYKDIDKLNQLKKEVEVHPLSSELMKDIELAIKIITENVDFSSTIVKANQHGDMKKHARENLKMSRAGQNLQSTGMYVLPNQKITVYLDIDKDTEKLPYLQFAQNEGHFSKWRNGIALKPGKNEIIIPEVDMSNKDRWKVDTKPGGSIYIDNPYTFEEQGKAPRIRIEGAKSFPLFKEGDNVEKFKEELKAFKIELDKDNSTGANQVLDIVEIESDRMLITTMASSSHKVFIEEGINPNDVTDFWNDTMNQLFKVAGIDGSKEIHDAKFLKEHIRLAQPHGFMYAAGDHIGIPRGLTENILRPDFIKSSPWGIVHEIGHRLDVKNREFTEITNNMYSMHMLKYFNATKALPYEAIYTNIFAENPIAYDDLQWGQKLMMMWQLELNTPGYWEKMERVHRERDLKPTDLQNKKDLFLEISSEIANENLSEHFITHGFAVSDEVVKKLEGLYGKSNEKTWYYNEKAYDYKGNGLNEKTIPKVEMTKGNVLQFSINADDKDVMGFEIIRDGKAVGYTTEYTFTDPTAKAGVDYKYQVRAYGSNLSESPLSAEITSLEPSFFVLQDRVFIEVNKKFNPMDYIQGHKYDGTDLKDNIKVEGTVDTSKPGVYDIKYTLTDSGVTKELSTKVEVVSKEVYVSDQEWVSAKTEYKEVTKDRSSGSRGKLRLDINATDTSFDKGLGAVADSEIVYNIDGKKYDYFAAYIGKDLVTKSSETSFKFKVIADGKEIYSSDLIRKNTQGEFIYLNITGVKELKLVTDKVNNNITGDFGAWADAKFISNNTLPTIEIDDSITTLVGKPIENIVGSFKATDLEDGDLTSKVEVIKPEGINYNKPGTHDILYKVKDSQGNEVSKKRTIAVIDERDSKILTDYEWDSAVQSYKTTQKDTNMTGGKIKLTGENGEIVEYDRGIGAHANATIIYNLEGKDYERFTSYIGADRLQNNTNPSITFEVYVDGVMKYDSGLMRGKEPQKFIDVNISNAKELKLVVTNGGNGNGHDHASFGNPTLYYANSERADLTPLKNKLDEVSKIDTNKYTDESVKILTQAIEEGNLLLNSTDVVGEKAVNETIEKIDIAVKGLKDKVEDIVIPDIMLEMAIRDELDLYTFEKITTENITKLKKLNASDYSIQNLEGLQFAINLETLDISNNGIKDLSILKGLEKLTAIKGIGNYNVSGNEVIFQSGEIEGKENGFYIIDTKVKDRDGSLMKPESVELNGEKLNVEEIYVDGKIKISGKLVGNTKSVKITYKSTQANYTLETLAHFN